MASVPFTSGDAAIARRFLLGQYPRIAMLGDSVLLQSAQTPYWMLDRVGPVIGYGSGQRWSGVAGVSGCFTSDPNTPTGFNDPLDTGAHICRVDFQGGASNASATTSANRVAYLGNFGPCNGAMDSAASDSSRQKVSLCTDYYANTVGNGRDLTVHLPIWAHPDGPTNDDFKAQVLDGSTVLATSAWFNGYAATAGWRYVTFTIPESVANTYSWLQLEVRIRESTNSQNGKWMFLSGRVTLTDPTITTGHELHKFCQGGFTLENAIDTATWDANSFSIFGLIKPDLFWICYGLNDGSGGDDEVYRDHYVDLADRIHQYCPGVPIIIEAPHAKYSYGANYGGEGPEPFYTTGGHLAQQAIPNSLFLNNTRAMPRAGVIKGYYSKDFSSITNGEYIWPGGVVDSSSIAYGAKVGHWKTGTAPASDATNWQSLSASGSVYPNHHRLTFGQNPGGQGDGIHLTLPGSFLKFEKAIGLIQRAAAADEPQTIADAVKATLMSDFLPVDLRKINGFESIDNLNFAQLIAVIAAVSAGNINDSDAAAPKIRNLANTINRITASVTAAGNRSTTLNVSDLEV